MKRMIPGRWWLPTALAVSFLAGCVIPENAERQQLATNFGGDAAISGTYSNEGHMRTSYGHPLRAHLHSNFGQQPKGVYYSPDDTVRISLSGQYLDITWLKQGKAISTVTFERGRDFEVAPTKIVLKPKHREGGGLVGTVQFELAKDSAGRLLVLQQEVNGPGSGSFALLARRFIDLMTFDPR